MSGSIIPEREENELRKWYEIVEKAPDKFYTFWWLKHVKILVVKACENGL